MNKNKLLATIIIVAVVLVAGLILFLGEDEGQDNRHNIETVTKIPAVNITYKDDMDLQINGYTMEMDQGHIRDTIVPVPTDRKINMNIKVNGNDVKIIKYEIKSSEDGRLIDSNIVEEWKEKEGSINCQFYVSAILEKGQEYYFNVQLETNQYETINYYTRILLETESFVEEQIKFAKDFSDTTFNESKATKLAAYLEPNEKIQPNDNLGKVTIHSAYGMLLWKTMTPEKISDTKVVSKEFCIKETGQSGTYTLYYQIKATNAQKTEEVYNVAETITVWTFGDKQYVLDYNREVSQVWEATDKNIGNAFIDLGVQKITSIDYVESENQRYIAYEINGDVYVMDMQDKKFRTAYKLGGKSFEVNEKTKSRVITVDDSGNVDFIVYGYSLSDQHAGKNGISVLQYNFEENKSREAIFIPNKYTADILQKRIEKICHLGDGTLYIMIENTIYYVNLTTKEWGKIIDNIEDGCFAVNEGGTAIAYNTSGKFKGNESITVVNIASGEQKVINAPQNCMITVFGFTGKNLVYGIGDREGSKKYPLYKLQIVDKDFNTVKIYGTRGTSITAVEITDTIINIKKWKNGKAIQDDHLLDNTENKVAVAKSSYYKDDIKMNELALAFTNNLDASKSLNIEKAAQTTFDSKTEVNVEYEDTSDSNFYMYGSGKLIDIYTNQTEAQNAAKKNNGLVVNEKGHKVWTFEEHYD